MVHFCYIQVVVVIVFVAVVVVVVFRPVKIRLIDMHEAVSNSFISKLCTRKEKKKSCDDMNIYRSRCCFFFNIFSLSKVGIFSAVNIQLTKSD